MKLKVFTLRLDPASGVFDDSELQSFLEHREALDVSEHFLVHERVPTWALLVSYRDVDPLHGMTRSPKKKWDPTAALSAEDRPLYEALRQWRNERAKRDGRPAYVLFTNRQMAEVAGVRPANLTALEAIEGIGEGRVRDLGEEVLALVGSHPPGIDTAPETDAEVPEEPDGDPAGGADDG
jgi:superfamily II DNA helicase RecQ